MQHRSAKKKDQKKKKKLNRSPVSKQKKWPAFPGREGDTNTRTGSFSAGPNWLRPWSLLPTGQGQIYPLPPAGFVLRRLFWTGSGPEVAAWDIGSG